MRPVSESLLLTTAQIAATLIGLLLVGVFFYLETGMRRLTTVGPAAGPFFRATSKLILLLYSLVLGLSLALAALEPLLVTVVYVLLAVAIVVALVQWTLRLRDLERVVRIRKQASPWFAWPAILVTLAVPWVLEGWRPGAEAMAWTLLLAGALAFVNTVGLLLIAFDLNAVEEAARRRDRQNA